MLLAPGVLHRVGYGPKSAILDIRFSAIPAIGSRIPFSMVPLPLVVPGPWDSALWELPSKMSTGQDSRWASQQSAWVARRIVDDTLFEFFNRAFRQGRARSIPFPPGWLRDTIQAAIHHLDDPQFTPSAFAALAGCSPEHLNRCLRQHEHRTTSQFLRKLRIERAAHMIQQDPGVRTLDVVARCGFTDARQFRLQWKAETGTGLREFRRQVS